MRGPEHAGSQGPGTLTRTLSLSKGEGKKTLSGIAKQCTRAHRAPALALAGAALLCAGPSAVFAAEEPEGACVRIARQEAVLEGGGLRVRGEAANTCTYVVRDVRVEVETRDQQGQVLGTGEGFADPTVLGVQGIARFDVPVPANVMPAAVTVTASWRRVR